MTRYLLDTNIVSHLVRGHRTVDRHLIQAPFSSLCISAISEGEVLFGLASVPHAVQLQQTVHEFLVRIEVLPWEREAAQRYGALRAELQRTGRVFGALDMLIAAHAQAASAVLVTNDRAFRHVPGLVIEDWTQ
jgi:tRNA(fMet)-specific endonuclease VapC